MSYCYSAYIDQLINVAEAEAVNVKHNDPGGSLVFRGLHLSHKSVERP